jgi:GT2 family glycosyltransferase
MAKRKISAYIVILNYNSFKETADCIASVEKEEREASYKIILVDNAAREFDERKIKKLYPDVVIVKSTENIGFAGGVNIGVRMAIKDGIDYTLLLNNDTTVTKNFLSELIRTAKENTNYGLVAPLITYFDNPGLIWFRGGSFNENLALVRHINMNKTKTGFDNNIFETKYITGCCMLIKNKVFKKTGLFDESYFLYNEDLDFCYKCRQNGFKLMVNPAVEVLHKISASTNRGKNAACDPHRFSRTKAFYASRNDLLFIKKNYGYLKALTATLGVFLVKYPYFILYLVRKRQFAELKEYLRGICAGIKIKPNA